jgi:acyl-CoA dehydrogenase
LLVVETGAPGFAVTRRLAKMGWHCSDTAELGYAGVRVPAEHLVGDEGAGFGQIMRQFVTERLALAVHAYAVAARTLALTRAWTGDRVTFGAPLAARQAVVHRLVEMHQRVELARTFTRAVVVRHVAGEDVTADACLAKNAAVAAAEWVVDQAVQLHGGAGYLRETEVERHYRDVRILGIGGGATEVLADLAGRLLGYTAASAR